MKLAWALDLLLKSEERFIQTCRLENYQGSGPGGQKKNRVKSGVRLRLSGTDLSVTSGRYRETARNKKNALEKLRLALVLNYFSGSFAETLQQEGELSSVLRDSVKDVFRDKINTSHRDYCLCLYSALGELLRAEGDLKAASQSLHISSSRLVKFLGKNKQALEAARRVRLQFGKRPLKF